MRPRCRTRRCTRCTRCVLAAALAARCCTSCARCCTRCCCPAAPAAALRPIARPRPPPPLQPTPSPLTTNTTPHPTDCYIASWEAARDVHEQMTQELANLHVSIPPLRVFLTSIYDHSVFECLSKARAHTEASAQPFGQASRDCRAAALDSPAAPTSPPDRLSSYLPSSRARSPRRRPGPLERRWCRSCCRSCRRCRTFSIASSPSAQARRPSCSTWSAPHRSLRCLAGGALVTSGRVWVEDGTREDGARARCIAAAQFAELAAPPPLRCPLAGCASLTAIRNRTPHPFRPPLATAPPRTFACHPPCRSPNSTWRPTRHQSTWRFTSCAPT